MERLFIAPDLPPTVAAVKIGAILILRDQAYEAAIRALLRDTPLQLVRIDEIVH